MVTMAPSAAEFALDGEVTAIQEPAALEPPTIYQRTLVRFGWL